MSGYWNVTVTCNVDFCERLYFWKWMSVVGELVEKGCRVIGVMIWICPD